MPFTFMRSKMAVKGDFIGGDFGAGKVFAGSFYGSSRPGSTELCWLTTFKGLSSCYCPGFM